MTKLNQILSKPLSGWSTFHIGDFSFPVSYLNDTPQEFIDAFIYVLKNNSSAVVELDGEGAGECLVVICPYAGIYTIVNHSDDETLNNNIDTQYFHINTERIAKQFIKDIEDHEDLWADWQSFGEEELRKYYDLSELKKLIDA